MWMWRCDYVRMWKCEDGTMKRRKRISLNFVKVTWKTTFYDRQYSWTRIRKAHGKLSVIVLANWVPKQEVLSVSSTPTGVSHVSWTFRLSLEGSIHLPPSLSLSLLFALILLISCDWQSSKAPDYSPNPSPPPPSLPYVKWYSLALKTGSFVFGLPAQWNNYLCVLPATRL